MFKFALIIVSAVLAGVPTLAAALEYRDGEVALSNNDAPKAAKIWTALAEKGDVIAQSGLGMLYTQSWKGLKKDYQKSAYWLEKCEPRLIVCTLNLANAYNDGEGVRKDPLRAAELYLRVINSDTPYPDGVAKARTKLGVLHLSNDLGKKNRLEAEKLLRPAAEGGYQPAQFWMGMLSDTTLPATPDSLMEAAKWYRLALVGDAMPSVIVQDALDRTEKKLTLAEREKAKGTAAAWSPKRP